MHFRFTRSPGLLIFMIRYRQRELNRFTVFKLDPFSVTFRHYQPCDSDSMNRWCSHLFMSAVRNRRTAQERYSVLPQWACSVMMVSRSSAPPIYAVPTYHDAHPYTRMQRETNADLKRGFRADKISSRARSRYIPSCWGPPA